MIRLSASRIKTLETCSYLYYVKYVLKLPDRSNKGAELGTITHLVLEALTREKRKDIALSVLDANDIYEYKPISRLVKKHIDRLGYGQDEMDLINKYCLVALKNDFFLQNFDLGEPELAFDIKTDNYNIVGFIDKYGIKDTVAKVVDYKTSKQKFTGSDAKFNIQALMYTLAAKKLWPSLKKVFINFLFLKFPNSPKQVFSYSDKEINGFEQYLEYLTEFLENFSYTDAKSNLAYHDYNKKRLCGSEGVKDNGEVKWICPFQKPFQYWEELDKDGKFIKNHAYETLPIISHGDGSIILREYAGCPAFNNHKNIL